MTFWSPSGRPGALLGRPGSGSTSASQLWHTRDHNGGSVAAARRTVGCTAPRAQGVKVWQHEPLASTPVTS
jgi:hypothetical protein